MIKLFTMEKLIKFIFEKNYQKTVLLKPFITVKAFTVETQPLSKKQPRN